MNRTPRLDVVKATKRCCLLAYVGIIGFVIFPFKLGVITFREDTPFTVHILETFFKDTHKRDLDAFGVMFMVIYLFTLVLIPIPCYALIKSKLDKRSHEYKIFVLLSIILMFTIVSQIIGSVVPLDNIESFSFLAGIVGGGLVGIFTLSIVFCSLILFIVLSGIIECLRLLFPMVDVDQTKNV
jgi:hypothetical protein